MQHIEVGFPEMWQPVYDKYQLFFNCAAQLQPLHNAIMKVPLTGELHQIMGRMATAAFNSMGALLLLVLNGYGHDAMKIARSIFEMELTMIRLRDHPEEIRDFMDYSFIQQKQLYDVMDDEQRAMVPRERYEQMMADYNRVLPRFASKRNPTVPRNQWCKDSIYERTKQAGTQYLDLYRTFYRQASSLHHLDIAGIIAHTDADMQAQVAPSWELLDDSILALRSVMECVLMFDEIAGLGLHDRLKAGPEQTLAAALQSMTPHS
jgi:hypothetical protein